MEEKRSKKDYGALALIPFGVFLVLYVGCGIVFTILGTDEAFYQMPRYTAMIIAILVAFYCYERGTKLSEKVDIYCAGAGKPGIMQLGLILFLAGGFANSVDAIGGKTSMVNLGIQLVPSQFLIPGIFIICCVISTCIGTSMGTQVTMIPVAIALAQGAGLNVGMAGAAAIAGAYFGDNLSMISDTTIAATQGVGANMTDKFKMNFLIALPAAILTVILYAVLGLNGSSAAEAAEAGSYSIPTIIPYISVIVLALAGMDVVNVLTIGMGLSCIIGLATGSLGFFGWAKAVGAGMEDMFWLAVFAIMISGLVELVKYYGGIAWLLDTAKNKIKSRKSCEYIVGLVSFIISGITLNNTVAIIVSAPIAKELGESYKVAPKRLASLLDIFGCAALMVVPHDSGMLLVQQYGGCTYFDIIRYCFYPVLLLGFTCITVQLGLMRTKEEKEAAAQQKLQG